MATYLPAVPPAIIRVTAKHILNGIPNDGSCCAIALSMKEAGFAHVTVSQETIVADGLETETPREVKLFIQRFDQGLRVEPMEFPLEVV